MPDPITDIADPEIQSELDGLRLLVEETEGNVIAFVRYERVTEREAGIRYLKEQLSIPVVERVLSEDRKNPLALLDNLPEERCCVQLYDLEEALLEVTGYLNMNREAYADVPHALVFWVGEHGLREVATNAPDFWAWRSGVFDVRSERPDLAQSVSQVALADDIRFTNRADLERRAELYEDLIQEYEEKDAEYVAQLRLKLSGVLYWLRCLEQAEEEAKRAKKYAEREDDEGIGARVYHYLGMIAQERESLERAEKWFRKSAEITKRLGDEAMLAQTYNNLGAIAQELQNFGEAEEWYRKSVEIEERVGNKQGAAQTYHNLGAIARKRRNWRKAEEWHSKSAKIAERLGDDRELAMAYHALGILAQERRNFEDAKELLSKSMEIFERLGDAQSAALTFGQRGQLAHERGNLREAGQWYLKATQGFMSVNDERNANRATSDFVRLFDDAPPDVRDDLRQQWIDAGLPEEELDDLLEQLRAEESN